MSMPGGWDNADVAAAQLALVLTELREPEKCAPYKNFLWAMALIADKLEFEPALLDIGCGVGHYGVLCEKFHPHIQYYGTDASGAMIEEARKLAPMGYLDVLEFSQNYPGDFDVVLASQVIEPMGGDVWANLRWLLSSARQYVILNRVRLTLETSHAIEESTYCGHSGRAWLWNQAELEAVLDEYCDVVGSTVWDNGNQATYVLEVRRGECTVRDGCAN